MPAPRRRTPGVWPPFPSFSLLVCSTLFVSIANAAITCKSAADAALATLRSSDVGLNWPCCSRTNASCITVQNDCPKATYPEFANCITAAGSAVCGLNADSQDTGAPCASYKGTIPPYGVWPVDPSSNLQFDLLGTMSVNWPKIIADDGLVVCCRDGNGSCHLANLEADDINPCDQGEYELFCVGDAKQGMCTVRANTRKTHEIGQYFRINLDAAQDPPPQPPSTSPPASGPSQASSDPSTLSSKSTSLIGIPKQSLQSTPDSTHTHSTDPTSSGNPPNAFTTSDGVAITGSQPSPSTPSRGGDNSPHILPIVLPIILILVLALCLLLGILWRQRRRGTRAVEALIDPLPGAVQLPVGTNSVYFSTESDAPTESYQRSGKAFQMNISGVTGGVTRNSEIDYSNWHGLAPPAYSQMGS